MIWPSPKGFSREYLSHSLISMLPIVRNELTLLSTEGVKNNLNVYGSLPKTSNTLNIQTPKIIAKNNFKMFP